MENKALRRYLNPIEVFALSFGCCIGWAVFIMPGVNYLPVAGPIGTLIGLLIGAAVMFVIARNYHIMMQRCEGNGGTFTFAKVAFGKDHGFLAGWFLLLVYIAMLWANSSALVLLARYTIGSSIGNIFEFGFHYQIAGYDVWLGEMLFSLSITIILLLLTMFKKKIASTVQVLLASILIIGVIVSFIWVLTSNTRGAEAFSPAFNDNGLPFTQVLSIIALMPWAFVGFESISHSAGEMKFPVKKTIFIMIAAIIFGAICYIFLTGIAVVGIDDKYPDWLAYIKDLPNLSGIASVPTFNAVRLKMGQTGIIILGITMMGALGTSIIANATATSRIMVVMSEEELLPKWFGKINKDGSPQNALLFILVSVIVVSFFGRTAIVWIADVTTICATIAFLYTSLACLKISYKEKLRNGIVTGIIGTLMSLVFFAIQVVPNLIDGMTLSIESYLIIALWGVLGLVFFRLVVGSTTKDKGYGKSTVVCIFLLSMILVASLLWLYETVVNGVKTVETNIDAYLTTIINDPAITEEEVPELIKVYSSEQAHNLRTTTIATSIVVGVALILAIALMFNIYSLAHKKERTAQIQKIQAEEKDKAKSFFLFNMSHDIRTPMNAIVGFTELAKDPKVSKEQAQDYLEKIDTSSKQLLSLINDVLEMSRIENGKYEVENNKVNLISLLEEMKTIFSVQMSEKSLRFNIDYKEIKHPHVLADKKGLNRILLNLIGNAYKFTPTGGSITVKMVQNEEGDKIHHILTVEDTGIGMSEEFLTKIFDSFEREKENNVKKIEGTGLGMAITKSIVEAMGGKIEVASTKGKGSKFTIHLDLELSEENEEDNKDIEFEENINYKDYRVLIIDDVEINREIAVLMTEKIGFKCEAYGSGREALNALDSHESNYYNVILSDVQMPEMDGYEFTRLVRSMADKDKANLPILAFTANAFEEDVKNAYAHGMNGHVAKPIAINDLEKALKKAIIERR